MDALTELSLFSGTGGGLLATTHLLGWRTVCYVEHDQYAIDVLKARIRDGYLHDAPIWDDVFTFDGRPWVGLVDVVTAGFPCQPFSVAGKGLGENDPRNGWPATIRIIREVRPIFTQLENVPGLTNREKFTILVLEKIRQFSLFHKDTFHGAGRYIDRIYQTVFGRSYFGRVLGDLAEAGFDVEWDCISAAEIGANHKRDRIWIVAYSKSNREFHLSNQWEQKNQGSDLVGEGQEVSDSSCPRREPHGNRVLGRCEGFISNSDGERRAQFNDARVAGDAGIVDRSNYEAELPYTHDATATRQREYSLEIHAKSETARSHGRRGEEWWAVEPRLGRVADGVAHRVDRLRAIGNGQVPDVAAEAWDRLSARLERR